MRELKKKTIALVLASAVTVAGSFAAENYKNSLLNLDFQFATNGSGRLLMLVETKTAYSGNVMPSKKDDNTYILMLPEIDSKIKTPDITKYNGLIKNISIRTMPYTNTGKGYTKITITTENVPNMIGMNRVFIANKEQNSNLIEASTSQSSVNERRRQEELERQRREAEEQRRLEQEQQQQEEIRRREIEQQKVRETQELENLATEKSSVKKHNSDIPDVTSPMPQKDSTEAFILILGIILIFALSIFFYVRAKDKFREITGESFDIDVDDKEKPKKNDKKTKKIKNTIKTLDSSYSKTAVPKKMEYTQTPVVKEEKQPVEELNVVDLDELFKETIKTNKQTAEEENAALEDFLSGFSFDESLMEMVEDVNEKGYDEEFYEKIINKNNLKFSKDDKERINKLLNVEIEDSTLRNIDKYLVSNPIVVKKSKKQVLEDLVTTYAISQNILFTQEDIKALYKLISVEIDNDFVTDLRTNPERLARMQKEMEEFESESKKPSSIITLSVKDMLPDLSEALRKQAGKKIEPLQKTETIYASEGYEVSTFKVDLPDLSTEINNHEYVSKPSAAYDIVDNSYEVQKLSISFDLPDLRDALAHPEKYERKEEEVVVDEKELLKNIANVQFKPFDEGKEYEILNDIPSVDEIQQEMSQFDNFVIADENAVVPDAQPEYDDFESLYRNEYVDLDNLSNNNAEQPKTAQVKVEKEEAKETKAEEKVVAKNDIVQNKKVEKENTQNITKNIAEETKQEVKKAPLPEIKLERSQNTVQRKDRENRPSELLNQIATRCEERAEIKKVQPVQATKQEQKPQETKTNEIKTGMKCIVGNESFNVVSSVELTHGVGCYLAKNNSGYSVLGYVGDNITKLKQYDELKSEKIQARKNEELGNGVTRYIVRIGMAKFIVNVKSNEINYVMDL